MGYFEKQAIPRINGYFDITVSMHSESKSKTFQNESRDSRSPTRVANCRYHLHKKNSLEMFLYLKKAAKKTKIILVLKVF